MVYDNTYTYIWCQNIVYSNKEKHNKPIIKRTTTGNEFHGYNCPPKFIASRNEVTHVMIIKLPKKNARIYKFY